VVSTARPTALYWPVARVATVCETLLDSDLLLDAWDEEPWVDSWLEELALVLALCPVLEVS